MFLPRFKRLPLVVPLVALFGIGCAEGRKADQDYEHVGSSIAPKTESGAQREAPSPSMDGQPPAPVGVPPAVQPGPEKPAPVTPMIVYTANLEVVVKDLDEATREVHKHLDAQKGRVVKSEVRSDTGARRTATFTLAVPVGNFTALVDALTGLGHPERNSVDSQDVTEEFVDVEARLKNLRQHKAKLEELLAEKRKEEKLADVDMLVSRIFDVQQNIERMEGRRNYLLTKSANSTVHLTLKEIKDYQPPTAPTFGDRVGRTFRDSTAALRQFGEGVALTAVALTPWLPILIPLGIFVFWAMRKARRSLSPSIGPAAVPRPAPYTVVETPPERPLPPTGSG